MRRRFERREESWEGRDALAVFEKKTAEKNESLPSRLLRCERKNVLTIYSSSPSRPSRGVMVPKRPSTSLLIPAVKNRVLAGPAPPSLPKVSDHRPSMVMSEPSAFFTKPMNLWVKPLNAAIHPLRKLPMRMALLNSPKSRLFHTTPQRALNQSPSPS